MMKSLYKTVIINCLAGGFLLFQGCKSDYCAVSVECTGGNDADIEACEVMLDDYKQIAKLEGCSDAFNRYMDCVEENGQCEDEVFTTDDECNVEEDALNECL